MIMTKKTCAWLARPSLDPEAKISLFCFPYAGGSSSIFRTWQEEFPRSIEVCPVQLPGRGSRMSEPPFKQLSQLVEALAEGLLDYMDKPFAFFGHSMGGMISFELSRLLRREFGRLPFHIFISGRRAPQLPNLDPPTYNLAEAKFIEELRCLKGTPAELLENPELMRLVLPSLRADFEVCQTYTYSAQPPLSCPISAFGGTDDDEVRREHLEPWGEQTSASFSLRMLSGDHFFLHSSQSLLLKNIRCEIISTMSNLE